MTRPGRPYQLRPSLVVFVLLVAGHAVAGTIDSCGTIRESGTWTVTRDLTATGSCLDIEADDVTLDLDGHVVVFDTASSGNTHGVRVGFGRRHVTVRNGSIRQGGSGDDRRAGDVAVLCDECNSPSFEQLQITVDGMDTIGILVRQGGTCANGELVLISGNQVAHHGTLLSSRDGFTSIPIKVEAPRSRVEIRDNTITDSPQAGIFLSHTSSCGDGSEITGNLVDIDDAIYANAAGIISYRGGAYDIHDNRLVGRGMEGIQLDHNHYQAPGHRTKIHDNYLDLDYQYTARGHSSGVGLLQGIRIRYQPEAIDIYDNEIRVHSDSEPGPEQNSAWGIWITMHGGEGGPGRDVNTWNNTVTAEGTGTTCRAVALQVDGVDDECGPLRIHDNTFRSNNVIVRFEGNLRTDPEMLSGNRFGFTDGELFAPHTFVVDWGPAGTATSPAVTDATYENGASFDDVKFGTGDSDKQISSWWRVTTRVVDGNGIPVPGADVELVDASGRQVAAGRTGSDGTFTAAVEERRLAPGGTSRRYTPHVVRARKNGEADRRQVTVDHAGIVVELVLPHGNGNDPGAGGPSTVSGLIRFDTH